MCQVLVTCTSSVTNSKYVLDPNLFGSLGSGGGCWETEAVWDLFVAVVFTLVMRW